jgi:ABC-type cobalt transport system substrate-binding protein
MLKRYTFWLTAAVLFQFLTAILHSITLFVSPPPENETERQLQEIVNTYRPQLDPLFHPTVANLMTALSSCFSFACLLGGLTLGYLLLRHAEPTLMKGMIGINLIVFGAVFVVMAWLTFSIPIVCTGLIAINLLAAYILVPKAEPRVS